MTILNNKDFYIEEYNDLDEIKHVLETKSQFGDIRNIIRLGYLNPDAPIKVLVKKLVYISSRDGYGHGFFMLMCYRDANINRYHINARYPAIKNCFIEQYYPKYKDDEYLEELLSFLNKSKNLYQFYNGSTREIITYKIDSILTYVGVKLAPRLSITRKDNGVPQLVDITEKISETELANSSGVRYDTSLEHIKKSILEKFRIDIKFHHKKLLEAKKMFCKVYNMKEEDE